MPGADRAGRPVRAPHNSGPDTAHVKCRAITSFNQRNIPMSLNGKVALVTGSTSGIGLGIAEAGGGGRRSC